jgi:hypothetical protein
MSSDGGRWEPRYVFIPEGTHISKSRGSSGRDRDLLRDDETNELRGPAESIPADEADWLGPPAFDPPPNGSRDGRNPWAEGLGDLLGELLNDLVEEHGGWGVVIKRSASRVRRTTSKLSTHVRTRVRRTAGPIVAVAPEEKDDGTATGHDLTAAPEPQFRMTSDEYRARAQMMFAADAFARQQREILANSIIENPDAPPEVLAAVQRVVLGGAAGASEAELTAVLAYLTLPKHAHDRPELIPLQHQSDFNEMQQRHSTHPDESP